MPRLIFIQEGQLPHELEQSFLSREGFELVGAADGPDLLAKALSTRADLIIAAMVMPGMRGADLCAALEGTGRSSVPLLMLGASKDLDSALAAGASAFLPVPWTRRELLSSVRSFFPLEERSAGRAEVSLKVVCGEGPETYVAFTRDISATGLFLKGASPAEPGTRVRVRLRLPGEGEEEEMDLTAEVVRRVGPDPEGRHTPGVGVRFLDFPMAKRIPIARFVREHSPE